jgi:CheY-like chemotaxis protein
MSTESSVDSPPEPTDPVVLVVDDEEAVTEAYSLWVPDDCSVRTANDGEQALRAVDSDVDVALLDREMPGLSGGDVLDEIRERGFDCRVAMVTGVDPDFDIAEMPFDEYVTKPVSEDDVRETVERLLSVAALGERTREFFAVSRKVAALEAEKPADELAAADTYQRLVARRDELDAELDAAVDDLDHSDVKAAFRDL